MQERVWNNFDFLNLTGFLNYSTLIIYRILMYDWKYNYGPLTNCKYIRICAQ